MIKILNYNSLMSDEAFFTPQGVMIVFGCFHMTQLSHGSQDSIAHMIFIQNILKN